MSFSGDGGPTRRWSTIALDLHAHRGDPVWPRGPGPPGALQEALMALEGPQCAGVGIAPLRLAAITTTLLAVLKTGDHLLVCDNAGAAGLCDQQPHDIQ